MNDYLFLNKILFLFFYCRHLVQSDESGEAFLLMTYQEYFIGHFDTIPTESTQ